MGVNAKSFDGCRAVVSDKKTGASIADTAILFHDMSRNIIRIGQNLFQKGKDLDKVNVLILGNQGLYEYTGTLRKAASSVETEIALYAGKEKEARGYLRYEMRTKGRVESVFVADQEIKLRRMISVQIVNISASGIFFAATAGNFVIGEKIRIQIDLKGNVFSSDYEVIRLQKDENGIWGYGCKNLVSGKGKDENTMQSEPKSAAEEWVVDALKENASYEVLQKNLEKNSGYQHLLAQVTHFLENVPKEEERTEFIENISEKIKDMTQEEIFNCIYRERPREEEESRHFLNVMLLIVLWGNYLHMQMPEITELLNFYVNMQIPFEKNTVDAGKTEEQKELEEEQLEKQKEWENIVLFLNEYDTQIAAYEKDHTGIPLAFLVRMCYSETATKRKDLKAVFAENMLMNVMHRPLLLSDGTLCTLEYLLLNDLSHSIILENGIGKRMQDSVEPAWFIPQKKVEVQIQQSTEEPEAEVAVESKAAKDD